MCSDINKKTAYWLEKYKINITNMSPIFHKGKRALCCYYSRLCQYESLNNVIHCQPHVLVEWVNLNYEKTVICLSTAPRWALSVLFTRIGWAMDFLSLGKYGKMQLWVNHKHWLKGRQYKLHVTSIQSFSTLAVRTISIATK